MALVDKIVLHSGGLDSHITWLRTRYRPVYVKHGSEAQEAEGAALGELMHFYGDFRPLFVDGPPLTASYDGHVPHRNLLLIGTAAAATGARRIAYGALLGEATGDKSRLFRRSLSHALSVGEHRRITVEAPLARHTKAAALTAALRDYPELRDLLPVLVACNHGKDCGTCQGCYRRHLAEWQCGLTGPPALPVETDGAWANLRRTPPYRWPSLAAANYASVRAELARRQS